MAERPRRDVARPAAKRPPLPTGPAQDGDRLLGNQDRVVFGVHSLEFGRNRGTPTYQISDELLHGALG